MPCAVVLGCPPFVAFMGPQKLPLGMDEMEVAGGLAGEPIALVKGRTVDLLVPETPRWSSRDTSTQAFVNQKDRSVNRTVTWRSKNSICLSK